MSDVIARQEGAGAARAAPAVLLLQMVEEERERMGRIAGGALELGNQPPERGFRTMSGHGPAGGASGKWIADPVR